MDRNSYLQMADDPPEIVPVVTTYKGETITQYVRAIPHGVRVEELEAKNAKIMADGSVQRGDIKQFVTTLVRLSCCDKNGNAVFEEGDDEAIAKLPSAIVQPVATAALKLNRLTKSDLDELVKNSDGDLSDSTSTA